MLFRLSDGFACLLILLGVLAALGSLFIDVVHPHKHSEIKSLGQIFWSCGIPVAAAIGAYGLTRRQPFGLVLAAAPSLAFALKGNLLFALIYLAAALIIFGVPFGLVFLEVRKRVGDEGS
jgi:hypothetical protein